MITVSHFITGHSDVVPLIWWFWYLYSWLFRYRIRDEEMRWWRQFATRNAFQQRDVFLLGSIKTEIPFSIRKGMIDKPRNWWMKLELGRSLHVFLLYISIRQEIIVCMVPFFLIGWCNQPPYTIFITKVILISRDPDDTWVRKDGTHFFTGHSDTRTESIVQLYRKAESSSRRQLISAPNYNNTSKKDWNCARLRRADISRLNIRRYLTLSDFHYQTHTTLNLKICNKTDLIVKNYIFPKNNCRNIWIIQIKVVNLQHLNNCNKN